MEPVIRFINQKFLTGKKLVMSFSDNKTIELWQDFMPHRNEINNAAANELYSVEVYPDSYFDNFNPDKTFEKWAAVEVSDNKTIPDKMEHLTVPSGLYAVFIHKGSAAEGPKTYEYIFLRWLPISGYLLDNRPHFAVMGEKYKMDDPSSEEEIYIPIKPKQR